MSLRVPAYIGYVFLVGPWKGSTNEDYAALSEVQSCTGDCKNDEGDQDGPVIVGRQSWSMGAEGHAAGKSGVATVALATT